jgi:Terminase RNaseH-like domain
VKIGRKEAAHIRAAHALAQRGQLIVPPSATFNVEKLAFPAQLAAIRDPAGTVAICCGRQSGKTQAAAWYHTEQALANPGSLQVYMAPDRGWAKRIIWQMLVDLNDQYAFGAVAALSDLSMRYRNGATIALMGADNEKERKKIRGVHPIAVTIDEAQAFPFWLDDFINNDVRQAQRNIQGRLTVQGTPPASLEHPWFKAIWQSSRYSKHQWNITHWPPALYKRMFGQTAQEALAADLAEREVGPDNVTYRREMLGEFLADENALAYKFDPIRNLGSTPAVHHTVIGVDLGWHDATVICILGWLDGDPTCYQLHEEVHEGVTLTTLADMLTRLAAIWNPALCMVDSGGNRQGFETIKEQLTREGTPLRLERRPVLPIADQVGLVNQALQSGRLKLQPESRAASDMRLVTWAKGIAGTKLDDGFHSDAIPALTYAYQAAAPLLPSPPAPAKAKPDASRHPPGFDPDEWARTVANSKPWWEQAEAPPADLNPLFDDD